MLVTDEEFEGLLEKTPKLYHMAESKSWPSIKQRGLLSTTAILDLYEVSGQKRREIEEVRRPQSVVVEHHSLPTIVIRDQIPISDDALEKCLTDGLKPRDWYCLLNNRVFFWPSEERLLRLLVARAYRDKVHDILELNTRILIADYKDKLTLSPINSGSTLFNPRQRGTATFARVKDYAYAERPQNNKVAEFAIDYGVPNIADYVERVIEMKGDAVTKVIEE